MTSRGQRRPVSDMARLTLHLVLHDHQPVGQLPAVLDAIVAARHEPLIEALERCDAARVTLHLSGVLLEWLDRHHSRLLERLARLTAKGRIEWLGGGFYEPVLALIPYKDAVGQIEMSAGYLERRVGARPEGAWVTDGTWDPKVAELLVDGGARYCVLDEELIAAAGAARGLGGWFATEHAGRALAVLPSDQRFGQMIAAGQPWLASLQAVASAEPDETCLTLVDRAVAAQPFALPDQFDELARACEAGLRLAFPSETIRRLAGRGRIYPPAADRGRFLRNPCSDRLHKRMIEASRRYAAVARVLRNEGWRALSTLSRPRRALYRSQCHNAYDAGVGGGLIEPHLRAAVQSAAIEAECVADALVHADPGDTLEVSLRDLYADLGTATSLRNRHYHAVIRPEAGGTLSALDHLPTRTALHDLVGRGCSSTSRRTTHHDGVDADDAVGASLRDRFLAPAEAAPGGLQDGADLADLGRARYRLMALESRGRGSDEVAELILAADGVLRVGAEEIPIGLLKTVVAQANTATLDVRYHIDLAAPLPVDVDFGVEFNWSLAASLPGAPSWLEVDGQRVDEVVGGQASGRASASSIAVCGAISQCRVVVRSDVPVAIDWAPICVDDDPNETPQALALLLRRRWRAGTSTLDWCLAIEPTTMGELAQATDAGAPPQP